MSKRARLMRNPALVWSEIAIVYTFVGGLNVACGREGRAVALDSNTTTESSDSSNSSSTVNSSATSSGPPTSSSASDGASSVTPNETSTGATGGDGVSNSLATDDVAETDFETFGSSGSLPTAEQTGSQTGAESTGVSSGEERAPVVLEVDDVWSGHPVNFALVTTATKQFAAYFAGDQSLKVAARDLDSETWSYQVLQTKVGWDSHNHIAMAVDEAGFIHISGNMHNVPLIYFRSSQAGDITSLERVTSMIGSNEQSVTYPEFFRAPGGGLAFAYRDGGSGNGNHIFNEYDVGAEQWQRLLDTPLTDGEGQRNAYPVGPVQGPDDYWHLVWVWRDTPDADTNHDLSYARTNDLVHWESGDTHAALTVPIKLATADVVDPVPVSAGMINNNTKVGFDAEDRPVVVYHKYDQNGKTQLYNARVENGQWVVHQTSDWDYRWDFGGEGTLVFELEVEGVKVQPDGRLTQTFYHAQYGGWGAFELDPVTLAAFREIEPPLPYPPELDTVESTTAGMKVRWASDWSEAAEDYTYMLRWETLDSNRDMARSPVPAPTKLRLYGFPN